MLVCYSVVPIMSTKHQSKAVSPHNSRTAHLANLAHGSQTGCVRHDDFFVHVCFGQLVCFRNQLLGHAGILDHAAHSGHTDNNCCKPIHVFSRFVLFTCQLASWYPTNQTNQTTNPAKPTYLVKALQTTRHPDTQTSRHPDNQTTRQPDNQTTRQPKNQTNWQIS